MNHLIDRKQYQKPEASTVYNLIKTQAERNAETIAIAAPDRAPLTYGRLLSHIDKVVDMLNAAGVGRNDRVAIVLPNGPEMATAFIAVTAGATSAPLNSAYRVREFDFYLSDLNAKALIVWSEMDSPVRECAKKLNIPIIELSPELKSEAGIFKLSGGGSALASQDGFGRPDDIALVLHTSGTTSKPKNVPLTQKNICASAHNIKLTLELSKKDRCLNVMPLFHIHGLIGATLSSLSAGSSIVCTPGFDPVRFYEWMEAFKPTWFTAVPTMHQAILMRANANKEVIARSSIRFIRSCSASLPPKLMDELERTFNVPVIESYGMTEASHQMTSSPLPPMLRKPGSVGIAAGPDVAIMDDAGNLLSVDEVGEVVIRGINVTNGYENNPQANQSAFKNGWFRTGDQGRFDADGYLFLTGRIKEIINRGGEKIAPREIDEVLMEHPGVIQAIAFALPHTTLGEDLAAAVVLRENANVNESEIREFAASRLSDFKVPSRIAVVNEIPKGPTGKLQRIGLAEKLASKFMANFLPPRNSVEKDVSMVWSELLNVEQVGIQDNFFTLGGNSITAAQMISKIRKIFDKDISLGTFFLSPTIEQLAGILCNEETTTPAILRKKDHKPLKNTLGIKLKNRLLQVIALYAPGFTQIRICLHRARGVAIGRNVSIGSAAIIETEFPQLVSIGDNVTIGIRSVIIAHFRESIGWAKLTYEPTVRIEDDVFIGPGVIVLPNVVIGKGSVVAAGSVVNRSVPPHTMVQGNPAEPIAKCAVPLARGNSYEEFLRNLETIKR